MRVKTFLAGLSMALIGACALILTAIMATDIDAFREATRRQIAASLGRDLELGKIDIAFGWPLLVRGRDVRLANLTWAGENPMAQFDTLEGEIDPWALLIGALRLRSLTLFDGRIDLARPREGFGNWMFDRPGGGPIRLPASLIGLERLTLRRVGIFWHDDGIASQDKFRIGRADVTVAPDGGIEVQAIGSWNDNPYEALLSLPVWRADHPAPFRPRLQGKIIGVGFDLAVQSIELDRLDAFEADLKIIGRTLADIGMALGLDLPATPALDVSARLRRADGIMTIDRLRAKIGRSDIGGKIVVTDPEGRTRIEGNLASSQIFAADLLPIGGSMLADWIRNFDAAIDWRIDATNYGGVGLKGIAAHIESDQDVLTIGAPRIALGEGGFKFKARLDARRSGGAPNWKIQGAIDGAELAAGIGLFGLPLIANAQGTFGEFDLAGPGASLDSWLAGLSGAISLSTGPGEVTAQFVRFLPSSVPTFDCLAATLAIDRGLVVGRDTIIDAPDNIVVLEGSADLRGGIIDARSFALAKGQGMPSAARSVEINGPLSAPEATPGPEIAIPKDSELAKLAGAAANPESGEGNSCLALAAIRKASAE